MHDLLTQMVLTLARHNGNEGQMLGTAFLINGGKHIVTPRHVVGDNDDGLCIITPSIMKFDDYQDTTITTANFHDVHIVKTDPFNDIAILAPNGNLFNSIPNGAFPTVSLGSTDDVLVGEDVMIFGFPHCVEGRRALTMQKAMVGSKILVNSSGIKSKYIIINSQARPGQSGSVIYSVSKNRIIAMLIGSFAPEAGISLGGINPRELHQTTQCISAEYIKKMIED